MPPEIQNLISFFQGDLKSAIIQFKKIFDSISEGIYITDAQAVTLFCNEAYQKISGLTSEEVIGMNMVEMVNSGMINRSGTLAVLEKNRTVSLNQIFRTGKRALITSSPYFDEKQNIQLVITVVRDITEIYNLEARCRQIEQKQKSAMRFIQKNHLWKSPVIAKDPETKKIIQLIKKVSNLDSTVILYGETGVGKEIFARMIFDESDRSNQSYLSINCGAISPTLIESELFGYEKGTFTGGNQEGKMGIFESADKGTIFLDEVGDLPMEMQGHLLRVLQEMKVKRVGGVKEIPIDVRVIAATNRNLWRMVQENRFREDLYYRLNVIPITIPPLRNRRDDIIPLTESFLATVNRKYQFNKSFSKEAEQAILQYDWPGNIRELKNIVEQTAILSEGNHIIPSDLPFIKQANRDKDILFQNGSMDLRKEVQRFEAKYVMRAYEKYGTVRGAAKSLGLDPATYSRKRKRYKTTFQE